MEKDIRITNRTETNYDANTFSLGHISLVGLSLLASPIVASHRPSLSFKINLSGIRIPSSHSTNAISVALFLYCHLLTTDPASWSPYTRELAIFGLIVYAVSIVYGRLYCGMHSITDCIGGSMIGITIWATQWTFRHTIEYYMVSPVWWVPPLVVATGIFLVSIIPDPVDDCPCFDDCVAFIACLWV